MKHYTRGSANRTRCAIGLTSRALNKNAGHELLRQCAGAHGRRIVMHEAAKSSICEAAQVFSPRKARRCWIFAPWLLRNLVFLVRNVASVFFVASRVARRRVAYATEIERFQRKIFLLAHFLSVSRLIQAVVFTDKRRNPHDALASVTMRPSQKVSPTIH